MNVGLTLIPLAAIAVENPGMDNARDERTDDRTVEPPDQRDAIIELLNAALELALDELELDLAA